MEKKRLTHWHEGTLFTGDIVCKNPPDIKTDEDPISGRLYRKFVGPHEDEKSSVTCPDCKEWLIKQLETNTK